MLEHKKKLMDRYNKAQIYLLLLLWDRTFVFCETFSKDIVWCVQQSGFSLQAHTIRAVCLVFKCCNFFPLFLMFLRENTKKELIMTYYCSTLKEQFHSPQTIASKSNCYVPHKISGFENVHVILLYM
jgi:hypothetical protein